MPDRLNMRDVETVSDAILDGTLQTKNLSPEVQGVLTQYWESAGVDFNSPEVAESQLQAIAKNRADAAGSSFLNSPIFKPIEWVGSKLYQVYSSTISPMLSTVGLGAHRMIYGKDQDDQLDSGFWGFEDAQDLWNDAHNVSPGQSIWMLGLNNDELRDRGISPSQITESRKLLKAGKYKDEKTTKDPFGTRTAAEEYFGEGGAMWTTGTADFLVSWWADPLVLAGKAAGGVKKVAFTRPTEELYADAAKALEKQGQDVSRAGELVSQTPVFTKMVDRVMEVKARNPDSAALVLRDQFSTFKKSANGDAIARLLGQAKNADEVSDILRVATGDNAALLSLSVNNVALEGQVKLLTQRNAAHATFYNTLSPAKQQGPYGRMVKGYLDQQTAYVNKLNGERRVIDDKIAAFASIDNMNFNGITSQVGLPWRGAPALQEGDRFKPMRGQGVIKATGNLVYNASIGLPFKVIRSYNDIKPTHYVDLHAEGSYKEVEASLREARGVSRSQRDYYVNQYLSATVADRPGVLMNIERGIVQDMVAKHNSTAKAGKEIDEGVAMDLYKDFALRRKNGQALASQGKSYGTATLPDPANPALTYRVAEIESDGGRMISTPIFDTQLANSHVVMDFDLFEKMLKTHGSNWKKTREWSGDRWTEVQGVADVLNSTWKFAQLFRLGYAPRALADDFLGQVARFGGMDMATRAVRGGRMSAERFYNGRFGDRVADAKQELGLLDEQIDDMISYQGRAKYDLEKAIANNDPAVPSLERALQDNITDLEEMKKIRMGLQTRSAMAAAEQDIRVGRQVFEAPFAGQQGQLFRDLNAGSRNFQNLMGSGSDWLLKLGRGRGWENITTSTHGSEKHMLAWVRKINDQIGKSTVGRQVLLGADETDLVKWMRNDAAGQKYRADIGLKNISDDELARRVIAEVDDTLNPNIPGMAAIRQQVYDGKLDTELLELTVKEAARPMVNAESFRYATGESEISRVMDRAINGWYNVANQIPATKLLRNPLFGQQYRANLKSSMAVLKSQGVTQIDDATRKILETNARKSALDDVKKFTFTMDHETKMAYAMRHFGAFFGSQQESWNRWARIIADKPDVLARVSMVYGAPARAGMVVDQNGNAVDGAGTSVDPATGERREVKYSDRKILIQVPEYLGGKKLNKALGLDEDASLVVPMSTLELVLNHGDGAIPVGAGPYVQMSLNHFAKDDPKVADWSQKLGVLPFGAQESFMDFIIPNTGKKVRDSADEMGQTYQRTLFYAMQAEQFKYDQGMRDTEPTWDELKDRADRWTIARSVFAWSLPISLNGQDPYQFFRDEYNNMLKLDSTTADEKFYEKYGDSFYQFSQSMAKNNSGLRPTAESVQMSKYYQDLVDQVGAEYAGVIVGDEGDGKYSAGAYFYQKTHQASIGENITQRGSLSAKEAWKESQIALGWQQYRTLMDDVNSQLFDRGLKSYDEDGAEDLEAFRKAAIGTLTDEYEPDGITKNPFFNQAWADAWGQQDTTKYDRHARDLWKITEDPELWAKAVSPDGTVGQRSDIYTLRSYLTMRRNMQITLAQRGMLEDGSEDITAQSNADLKQSFENATLALLEADTKFSWLHSRFFATDMGFNMGTLVSTEDQEAMEQSGATIVGQQADTSILDTLDAGSM